MSQAQDVSMRQRTAVCGVGMTEIGAFPEETSLSLATAAFKAALDDAGLEKGEVDGLLCMSYGADYDRFLEAVGLNVRYAYQGWSHGRFLVSMVQHAAMAVHHGLADVIAIVHGRRGRAFGQPGDIEMWRQGLGPHGESPAYGALAPAFGVAISAQRYFHKYGGGSEDLAHIAIALRNNARLNPDALRREPMTVADHQASPWVVEPLRRLDCCQNNDGGACILITSADRAKDMKSAPVYLMGAQGVHAGPQYHNFAHVGLGVAQQDNFTYHPDDLRVYDLAGVDRDDVDSLVVYDAFTPLVLYALERFGFCGPGEAAEFVREGHTSIGGDLPVNTSGGLLSEGHIVGWNLLVELVRQLRHECGERQLPAVELIQWASFLGDSMIFRGPR
jgi:acetyl-CoA acetyltransferase